MKKIILVLMVLLFCGLADAVIFNGTTYYYNGTILSGVNVTIQVLVFGQNGEITNYTSSGISGSLGNWSIAVPNTNLQGNDRFVKFIPKKYNGNDVEWIGSVLDGFPFSELQFMMNLSNVEFYLKEGITVNITAFGLPTKLMNANMTQNLSAVALAGVQLVNGFEYENRSNRFAFLTSSQANGNSIYWLNTSGDVNSTYHNSISMAEVRDLEIFDNDQILVLAKTFLARTRPP